MNLECVEDVKYGLSYFYIILFLGIIFGSLIMTKIADVAGRKPVFFFGLLIHIVAVSATFLITDAGWFLFFIFVIGIGTSARYLVGYVYVSELCPDN